MQLLMRLLLRLLMQLLIRLLTQLLLQLLMQLLLQLLAASVGARRRLLERVLRKQASRKRAGDGTRALQALGEAARRSVANAVVDAESSEGRDDEDEDVEDDTGEASYDDVTVDTSASAGAAARVASAKARAAERAAIGRARDGTRSAAARATGPYAIADLPPIASVGSGSGADARGATSTAALLHSWSGVGRRGGASVDASPSLPTVDTTATGLTASRGYEVVANAEGGGVRVVVVRPRRSESGRATSGAGRSESPSFEAGRDVDGGKDDVAAGESRKTESCSFESAREIDGKKDRIAAGEIERAESGGRGGGPPGPGSGTSIDASPSLPMVATSVTGLTTSRGYE